MQSNQGRNWLGMQGQGKFANQDFTVCGVQLNILAPSWQLGCGGYLQLQNRPAVKQAPALLVKVPASLWPIEQIPCHHMRDSYLNWRHAAGATPLFPGFGIDAASFLNLKLSSTFDFCSWHRESHAIEVELTGWGAPGTLLGSSTAWHRLIPAAHVGMHQGCTGRLITIIDVSQAPENLSLGVGLPVICNCSHFVSG